MNEKAIEEILELLRRKGIGDSCEGCESCEKRAGCIAKHLIPDAEVNERTIKEFLVNNPGFTAFYWDVILSSRLEPFRKNGILTYSKLAYSVMDAIMDGAVIGYAIGRNWSKLESDTEVKGTNHE